MRAGEFDRRVTIEKKVVTQDPSYGTELITWTSLATVWAMVVATPPSRNEAVKMRVVEARDQATITLRYMPGVDSSMHIIVHYETDVTYQIIGGPERVDGRKRELEMLCERFST